MIHKSKMVFVEDEQIVDSQLLDRIEAAIQKAQIENEKVIFVVGHANKATQKYLLLYGYRVMNSKVTSEVIVWLN